MKDFYDILDVPPDASPENIKEQYRFLVQAWHPDKFPTPAQKAKAEEKIKEINGAFEVLGNPAKRAQYDRERHAQSDAAAREQQQRRDREQAEAAYRYAQEQRQRAERPEPGWPRETGPLREETFTRRPPAPEPTARELLVPLTPGVEMTLLQVRAGEFLYGEQNWPVRLDEYYLGKHPVTNAQFRAFLNAAHYPYPEQFPPGKDDFPVVNVSWIDAAAFCDWAARASGHPLRLPTEAEWEKAARGTDGRTYPWGENEPNGRLCNFNLHYPGPTPVLQFSPQGDSPYGCTDLAGNVWEWTADWYSSSYLNQNPRANPRGAYSGQSRVFRGGSWHDDGWFIRATYRNWDPPTVRNDSLGFRCAR